MEAATVKKMQNLKPKVKVFLFFIYLFECALGQAVKNLEF